MSQQEADINSRRRSLTGIRLKPRKKLIAEAIAALSPHGIDLPVQTKLAALLNEQPGRELYRANPRMLATHLQLPEREMLRILLVGLKEGIVTLNWEVECPACHGLDDHAKHLQDLKTFHTCPACHYIHSTDLDDGVHVTFSVDHRLRKLEPDDDDPDFRQRMNRRYGIVSGHRILTLPTFRRLFPRERLLPGESLLVRRVAVLFTDLAGSTALYARRGDAKAYELVRQHFDLLFAVVEQHSGVIVKTIGDAVMAAFTDPSQALEAAIEMHHQLAVFNHQSSLPPEDYLVLKIGIDVGPCISVTLNDRPDYFGTTVNTAARIQATSQGHNIAVTDALMEGTLTNQGLQGCSLEKRQVWLKGLDTPMTVHYISPGSIPGSVAHFLR